MAKTILRACDLCGAADGTTRDDDTIVTVRNTTVVGASKEAGRKDLCDADRIRILGAAGYTESEAKSIVAEHDKEKVRKVKATETESATAEENAAPPADPENPPPGTETASAKNGKAKVPAGAK